MSRVPNFGFSAFLKFLCSNEKPQRRSLKERHKPSEGGYDRHRSLRRAIQSLALNGVSYDDVLSSLSLIKSDSERASATKALAKFRDWAIEHKYVLKPAQPFTFSSPQNLFKITFQPNFITEIDGRITSIHIWNTKHPLVTELVLSVLSLVANRFPITPERPDDFAVLSLQNGHIYKWSDSTKEHLALGEKLLLHFEKICKLVRSDLGLPTIGDTPDEHPRT